MRTLESLSQEETKALAKELKNLIDSSTTNSSTNRTTDSAISEREFLNLFATRDIAYEGISCVYKLLSSSYAVSTCNNLNKKIPKNSVVCDTSISNLSVQKIYEILNQSSEYLLFPTVVMAEIQKTLKKLNPSDKNYNSFCYLLDTIINDFESNRIGIIQIPNVSSYTDDSILSFCKENNYRLFTYDYLLGLRARCQKVNVTIFNQLLDEKIKEYEKRPNGFNVILSEDLLESSCLSDVIKTLNTLCVNKIIVTSKFIDHAEKLNHSYSCDDKSRLREFINFLVYDEDENYCVFTDLSFDESSDDSLRHFCNEHKAVVLTADYLNGIQLKQQHINYRIVYSARDAETLKSIREKIVESNITEVYDGTSGTDVEIQNNTDSTRVQNEYLDKLPFFNIKMDGINFNNTILDQYVVVLDSHGNQVQPSKKTNYKSFYNFVPGSYLLHFSYTLIDNVYHYTMTHYKMMTASYFKGGQVIRKVSFVESEVKDKIPNEYQHYARYFISMSAATTDSQAHTFDKSEVE